MRRVPSCLPFAAFALVLGALVPEGALAEPGFKFGSGHHRAWGGHKGFSRGHWGSHRHGFFRHRGYAHHAPAFKYGYPGYRFGFHRGYGYLRHVYGRHPYGRYFHGYPGRYAYGRAHHHHGDLGYGRYGSVRHFYGHQGYGRHGYGYHGYGRHFYGRPGYGFFPHSTWVWPASHAYADATVVIEQGDAPPDPVVTAIPSLADLPVSLGIRSAPTAAPAIYTVDSGQQSLRSGRAKIVSLDQDQSQSEASDRGPRIIRLDGRR
ncbi:MAG: hypothetical protein M3158_09425 [Pseudomonadota bacterium]|nr:hypothetical protein [Pseudomonadota bacterium]